MTASEGSYSRFRRALDNGNLLAARAATELNHVGLAEALELTLLILAKEPTRFRAAALRWHARYCGDNNVSIEEATAVLGLLAMLEGRRGKPAAQALSGLLDSRTLLPAAEVLVPSPDSTNYECRVDLRATRKTAPPTRPDARACSVAEMLGKLSDGGRAHAPRGYLDELVLMLLGDPLLNGVDQPLPRRSDNLGLGLSVVRVLTTAESGESLLRPVVDVDLGEGL